MPSENPTEGSPAEHHGASGPGAAPAPAPASSTTQEPVARFAVVADAPELVRLRAVMFDSLGFDTSGPEWRARCLAHVEGRLGDGRMIGAVVDRPRSPGVAASALAELSTRIPGPSRPTGRYAYLSSVSTDPGWRRRGMARAVVSLLIDELSRLGVQRVELHATPDGEALYRSLGFVPRAGGTEMRLGS